MPVPQWRGDMVPVAEVPKRTRRNGPQHKPGPRRTDLDALEARVEPGVIYRVDSLYNEPARCDTCGAHRGANANTHGRTTGRQITLRQINGSVYVWRTGTVDPTLTDWRI